jgi:uncharacterized protein (DUF2249 family)
MTATNLNLEAEIVVGPDHVMDVREVPCASKHGRIWQTCLALPVGDYFIVRNGHEPARLREQLEAQHPGAFLWECLRREPDDVSTKITKRQATAAAGEIPQCHATA